MKKIYILLVLILIFNCASVFAGVDVNGVLNFDNRVKLKDGSYLFNEARFLLKFAADFGDNLSSYSSLRFRYVAFSEIEKGVDLEKNSALQPLETELDEIYVKYSGFIVESLDLTVGKQRINWGRADKLNPTDNINPDDYTDLFDFGKKMPSLALHASYSISDFSKIVGVFVPYMVPSRMPAGSDLAGVISAQFGGLSVSGETINLPEKNIENAMFAVKFDSKLAGFDFSVSYFHGYDDNPILSGVTVTTNPSLSYEVKFPKMQVIGFDLAGQLLGVGVWFEMGIFFPEKIEALISGLGPDFSQKVLDDKPFVKYTVGFDYTFKNGLYINTQWAHGLFTERGVDGAEELQDYLLMSVKNKFFKDKVQVMLLGGFGIRDLNDANDFDDIKSNGGMFGGVEFTYYPWDSTEIIVGVILIEGKDASAFGAMRDDDQVYCKCKVSF